jgi:hypothetical protein
MCKLLPTLVLFVECKGGLSQNVRCFATRLMEEGVNTVA